MFQAISLVAAWLLLRVVLLVAFKTGGMAGASIILALGWVLLASHLFARMWQTPVPTKRRFLAFAGTAAFAGLLVPTLTFKAAHIGPDRTLNEVANNGALSFVAAFFTRHLDYTA